MRGAAPRITERVPAQGKPKKLKARAVVYVVSGTTAPRLTWQDRWLNAPAVEWGTGHAGGVLETVEESSANGRALMGGRQQAYSSGKAGIQTGSAQRGTQRL